MDSRGRRGSRGSRAQLGLELPETGRPWPDPLRFPYNYGDQHVKDQLIADLTSSAAPLLLTGYASAEKLIELLHMLQVRRLAGGRLLSVRLLVGVEPVAPKRVPDSSFGSDLQQEIADYWLTQGISVTQWLELLSAIELLKSGLVTVRSSGRQRVHAKVYLSDDSVTLGSSNYTAPGLRRNLEANVRYTRAEEPKRFQETANLAENIWSLGDGFTDGFRELLERLLHKVTWREALARACAELLEGDWATNDAQARGQGRPLWPSQEQGVTQALWVLENVGAVLIADATGSGKTRTAAHLLRALQDRNWMTGRRRGRQPVLICPPAVSRSWHEAAAEAGESVGIFSQGVLSRQQSARRREVETALRGTEVLIVDEAHNFLNRMSTRSRLLYGNVADHVILLTATPINRGVRDLLGIVDLLGADNFDDDVLEIVGRLARPGRRSGVMSIGEKQQIRSALQQFVVRRTKPDFNLLIDQEPHRYTNALGERCRFPRHTPRTFERGDRKEDRQRALAVREKAKNLRGVVNLRRIEMKPFWKIEGFSEQKYVEMRLRGASALAAYQIRSRLRSSRVALVEHILGTEKAASLYGLGKVKETSTGDVITKLLRCRETPPEINVEAALPEWLTDQDAYRAAVEEEIDTYQQIRYQTEQMSNDRATANVQYLLELLTSHDRVIAFDSHLISLSYLKMLLEQENGTNVALATGQGPMRARLRFAERFGLESKEVRLIGLCSDALAEGLNLQGASAIVHLDLPTVVRVLEQRIGRVDRMDSPHEEVEVHWPIEPPEFQLRADERLFMRLRDVEDLLGSNVPLPEELSQYEAEQGELLEVQELIDAVDRGVADGPDLSLPDAFARVRALVAGESALVPREVYEALRMSEARVLSSVSVVRAENPWVFLAVGAADRGVPRWLFFEPNADPEASLLTSLDQVAEALRERLGEAPSDLEFDAEAAELLQSAIVGAEKQHDALLPRRKRRALEQMSAVLRSYLKERGIDPERKSLIEKILELVRDEEPKVDRERLAELWLELMRPRWFAHLAKPRITRPARLKHLRKNLKEDPISTERLGTLTKPRLSYVPLGRRVVAAIVGVGKS